MSDTAGGSSMNGSSSVKTGEVFDVSTPSGAVALLRRVHVAALPIEVKNQLRDAVFSYQNSALTTNTDAVQELFMAHGIAIEFGSEETPAKTPVENTEETPVSAPANQGFGRPAPSFRSSTSSASVEVPKPVDDLDDKEEVSVPEVPAEQSEAALPDEAPAEKVAIKKETEIPSPKQTGDGESDPAERIKEIKRTINGLVGNPVNLIDVDNTIGREYMNSLLDAMKKVNTGVAASDMERAMDRLEAAFKAAQETLEEHKEKPQAETEPVSEAREEEPEEVKSEEPVSEPETPAPAPEPMEEPASKEETVEQKPETPKIPEPVVSATPEKQEPESDAIPTEAVKPEATPTTMEPVAKMTPVSTSQVEEIPEQADSETEESDEGKTDASPKPPSSRFTAVAKEKQLKQLMQEQDAAIHQKEQQEAVIDSANPLMTHEITTGLEQLLSEWRLFKSSGIFGTGPSGVDHPLYKKLAPLTMAAVMTGRFDDASADIKQNITEYMSGWRYEEGIVYEPGETFEHYLRRVIKHILDKREDTAVDKAG